MLGSVEEFFRVFRIQRLRAWTRTVYEGSQDFTGSLESFGLHEG